MHGSNGKRYLALILVVVAIVIVAGWWLDFFSLPFAPGPGE